MTFPLPEGLPTGRFEAWGATDVWVLDELPQGVAELWARLREQHPGTGLLPVLCRPGSFGRPQELAGIDAPGLERRLAADFAEYRRKRLPWWTSPVDSDLPEDVEPFPHDPGPPFESWPGFAPPSAPASAVTGSLVGAVRQLVGEWRELRECRLLLVPAGRSADLPALLGWAADVPLPLLCALLRSWEERFGAQVLALCGSSLFVGAARPAESAAQAERLAVEHVLTTAASIVDDPPTPFPEYAAALVGRTVWHFWWD